MIRKLTAKDFKSATRPRKKPARKKVDECSAGPEHASENGYSCVDCGMDVRHLLAKWLADEQTARPSLLDQKAQAIYRRLEKDCFVFLEDEEAKIVRAIREELEKRG